MDLERAGNGSVGFTHELKDVKTTVTVACIYFF